MRVVDTLRHQGAETEAFGPRLMDRLGEVYVLNGRVMKAAGLMRQYLPLPERRMCERRQGERRKNRGEARRKGSRRVRDAFNQEAWKVICQQALVRR